jgi:hypothetical protein
MASLFFTCPATNQQVPTGIETDAQSLATFWKATLSVKCPHCVGMHEIPVRETYINNVLEDAAVRLSGVASIAATNGYVIATSFRSIL